MKIYPTKLIFILTFLFSISLSATEYYVTVEGKRYNDGRTEETAWSIQHAFENARAGDTIWVKAGNYGSVTLVVYHSGTPDKYIRFIGYKDTPGDVVSCYGSTFEYGDELDASKMPLLEGEQINGQGQGVGIRTYSPYLHIENFQITKYNANIFTTGNFNVLRNIISTDAGDFNPMHTFPDNTSNALLNYNGYGITLKGDYCTLENSIVVNSGAEGIVIQDGNNQTHRYNKVYSDSRINPCDYYYLITLNSNNNTIDNIYVERVGDLVHKGHGIVYKVQATNNLITNSTLVNSSFEHSFTEVKYNIADNITIIGGEDNNGAFSFNNGSHHNIVRNSKVLNASSMASFGDWVENQTLPFDIEQAGAYNQLINVVAYNCKYGVNFNSWDKTNGEAFGNEFINCTFADIPTLYNVGRKNYNNNFINCVFDNIELLKPDIDHPEHALELDAGTFTNCNFNTSFGVPQIIDSRLTELFGQDNAASIQNEVNSTQGFVPRRDVELTTSSSYYQSGNYSIYGYLKDSSKPHYMFFGYRFDAEIGKSYEIRFKATKTKGDYQRITDWKGFENSPKNVRISHSWDEYVFLVKATSERPLLKFYISARKGASPGDDFIIDDLSIKEVTLAPAGSNLTTFPTDFVDPPNADYRLKPSSSLLDLGITTAFNYDHNNISRPQGGAVDLGAYEYTSTNLPPEIILTSPCDKGTYETGENIKIQNSVFDAENAVANVELYIDGQLIESSTGPDFSFTTIFSEPGTYQVNTVVYDANGLTASSNQVELTIVPPSNLPPVVAITEPVQNSTHYLNEPINVSAAASDPDGVIAKVTFYLNDQLIATETNAPYTHSLTLDTLGDYTLKAIAHDNENTTTESEIVTFTIAEKPNEAPQVSLDNPTNNSSFYIGDPINVSATASDPDGVIAKVAFYLNDQLIATETNAPYTHSLTLDTLGDYTLKAIAYDNENTTTESEIVTFTIAEKPNEAPQVSLDNPANNSSFYIGEPINVSATASDPDGVIAKVTFYLNDQLIATETNAPYTHSLTLDTLGDYTLKAIAYDNENTTTESEIVAFTIAEKPNEAPQVSLDNPTNNSSFYIGDPINVSAAASDPDGVIAKVAFYLNDQLIATETNAPYTHSLTLDTLGDYTLKAIAYDNENTTTESEIVTFTIAEKPNELPQISVNFTYENAKSYAGDKIEIFANATDSDGTISRVEFFLDGNLIATEYVSPYTQSLTFNTPGIHTVFAIAYDNDSGSSTSNSIEINIEEIPNQLPTVYLETVNANEIYYTGDHIELKALASDTDGSVTKVEFYVNDKLFSTERKSPYTTSIIPEIHGTYKVQAIVYDNKNASQASDVLALTVNEPINQAPLISIGLSDSNTLLNTGDTLQVVANVNDLDGTVVKVEFFINNTSVYISETPPHSWNTVVEQAGIFEIKAIAYDNKGLTSESNILTLTSVESANTLINETSAIDIGQIKLYPNPTKGDLFIRGDVENTSLVLIDLLGRVTQVKGYLVNSNELRIDMAPYPPGVYILQITDENNISVTKKVIKN